MNKETEQAIASDEMLTKVWPNTILAGYRGSIAHGTAGDLTDDVDLIGVFVAPVEHYFGLSPIDHVDRVGVNGKYDFCMYEIKKLFKLLLKSNPNVLTLLWTPPNLIVKESIFGKMLIENRDMFLSKQVFKTYGGYAQSQLKQMNRPCTTAAFQGKKRRERFEKFGYDCKHASHLIRLLRMGIEILTTGEVNVYRHDHIELKAIKQGEWSLEKVTEEADRLDKLLYEAHIRSELPARPDFKEAEELLIDIVSAYI